MITKHAAFVALLASIALAGCSGRSESDPEALLEEDIEEESAPKTEKRKRPGNTRESISAIETAAQIYKIYTGAFPSSVDELRSSKDGRSPILDPKKPLCDAWGNDFRLRTVDGGFLEIRSAGPDGKMDTDDDITN